MAGPTKPRHNVAPKKKAFLAALAETGNVSRAAEVAGVDRRTHYRWLKEDEDYAERASDAMDQAADYLEGEARRRATEGLRQYKFDKGVPILHPVTKEPYYEHSYSDTLLIFLLKGARPEKYRDRQQVEHSGSIATPSLEVVVKRADESESDEA